MEFYVYILFRPWNGQPFYVGKGKDRRWLSHEKRGIAHKNKRIGRIIAKAKNLGMLIPKVKIRENLSENEAFTVEKALIAAIGRKHDGGPLVNSTDGGEGFTHPDPRIRAKFSAAQKQRFSSQEVRDEASRKTKLAWQDPEKRKRMHENMIGVTLSKEHKKKIGDRSRGRKMSEEAKAQISKNLMGHIPSEETRALWREQRKNQNRPRKNGRFIKVSSSI